MTAVEEWRTVADAPDYEVSNLGRVRSNKGKTPRVLSSGANGWGYSTHTLYVHGETTFTYAHTLVLAAFVGPRPAGMDARHLDGNPGNNRLDNLAYGTRAENMQDKRRHGTNVNLNKTHCPSEHPYDEANTYVTPEGWRHCRTCRAEASRRSRLGRALTLAT